MKRVKPRFCKICGCDISYAQTQPAVGDELYPICHECFNMLLTDGSI